MRATSLLSLLLLVALPLFAQRDRDPRGAPGDAHAIGEREIQRTNDELVAKHLSEAAAAERPLRSRKLKDAVTDFQRADYKVAPLHVTFGEFVTAKGQYYVAMHFAPSAEVAVPADGKVTFFGLLDAGVDVNGGGVAWSREEPVVLTKANDGGWYYERSFPLTPGNRNATFGFALKDQPIAMASLPMLLNPLQRTTRGVSRLIVSNAVFPLAKPQLADDPFAFGGIKVLPKADRTFRKSADELWIFFEAQNPQLDASGAPKLTAKVTLETEGKSMRGQIGTIEPMALKGVTGHFGVGTTVDVSRVPPGDYLLRVAVTDALANAQYELAEKIVLTP
jgi:hypothetical protein